MSSRTSEAVSEDRQTLASMNPLLKKRIDWRLKRWQENLVTFQDGSEDRKRRPLGNERSPRLPQKELLDEGVVHEELKR